MAGYIVRTVLYEVVNSTTLYHIGEKLNIEDVENVLEIQADGDELYEIESLFTNPKNGSVTIPWSHLRVQNWYGDIAKTIVRAVISNHKR
jgi:hypothetical protein